MKEQGLAIRLTEPVVFLRGGTNPRRTRRRPDTNNEEPADVNAGVEGDSAFHPPSFFPLNHSTNSPSASRERSRDRTPQRAADPEPEALGDSTAARPQEVPSVIRGLLTLTLNKPTRIRKIDLKFRGVSRSEWPDGIGPRRIEMSDEVKLVDETITFFDAAQHAPEVDRPARRARSVGPSQRVRTGGTRSPSRERGRPGPAAGRSSSVMPARESSIGPVYGARDTALRSQASSNHSRENILPELRNTISHDSSNDDSDVARMPITDSPAVPLSSNDSSTFTSPRLRTEGLPPVPGPSILRRREQDVLYPSESSVLHSSASSIAQVPEDAVLDTSLTQPPSRQPSSSLVHELMLDQRRSRASPSPSRGHSPPRRPSSQSLHRPPLIHSRSSSPDTGSRHRSLTPMAGGKRRTSENHHARFSLASIGDAFRSKSKSRPPSRRNSISEEDGLTVTNKASSRSRSRGRNKGLKALRDALIAGLGDEAPNAQDDDEMGDEEDECSGDEGGGKNVDRGGKDWREFTPGTYTWPIIIPVSSQLPPTISCNWGQTIYRLKAKVRRPGALTANLAAETEVQLVNTPGDDDTEESESIVVDRMWDTQLHYNIAILQKSFAVGGRVPLSIRLQPLSKMKLFRLVVCLDEKTTYYAHDRSMTKTENTKHIVLARYHHHDERVPLLPILDDDPRAILEHPLKSWFINPTSSDNTTPACLDPFGPWDLETSIPVQPDARLRFTMTNPQANMSVKHSVRVTLRVERGDDEFLDKEGKRKRFDIIVEAQINLLSAASAHTLLPAYSTTVSHATQIQPIASGSRTQAVSGYDTAAALALAQAAQNQPLAADQSGELSVYENILETQDFVEGRAAPPTYHYSMAHPETRYEPSPEARGRSRSRHRD